MPHVMGSAMASRMLHLHLPKAGMDSRMVSLRYFRADPIPNQVAPTLLLEVRIAVRVGRIRTRVDPTPAPQHLHLLEMAAALAVMVQGLADLEGAARAEVILAGVDPGEAQVLEALARREAGRAAIDLKETHSFPSSDGKLYFSLNRHPHPSHRHRHRDCCCRGRPGRLRCAASGYGSPGTRRRRG